MALTADQVTEQLGDIPDFLIRTRLAFYDHGSRTNAWVGEPGSQCRIDAASEIAGPSGPWGEKPFRWITETCGMYLAATVEHLRCLGLMLKNGGFFLSPEVIIRATYETSMRVVWMLDPEVTPKQRAARVYLETFHGLRRALEGYSRLWPDVAQLIKDSRREIFDEDVPALFWPDEIEFDDQTRVKDWRLASEPYPGPEEIVSLLAARSGIGSREVNGMYAILSAYIHPNPIELQRRSVPTEDGKGRGLSVTPNHLRRLVGSAVSGYYQAYRLQATYLGWDPAVFEEWERDASGVLPESFSDEVDADE